MDPSLPTQLGATRAEVGQSIAGDDLNPDPSFLATRAITIAGSPDEIWPWLLQMGYGRVGFYGYDLLENIGSPMGFRSSEEILPEFQRFRVGDEVPISAVVSMTFHAIEPNRHLIWVGNEEVELGVVWLTTWYTPIPSWLSLLLTLAAIGALYMVPGQRPEVG